MSQTELLKSPPKFASLAVLPILLSDNSRFLFTQAQILDVNLSHATKENSAVFTFMNLTTSHDMWLV